jgi:hypothetical protein
MPKLEFSKKGILMINMLKLSLIVSLTLSIYSLSIAQTTIFSEDFQGAFPNTWYIGNDGGITTHKWGDNSYQGYQSTWSGFCADNNNDGANSYPNNLHTFMEKRGVSLSGYSSAKLAFRYWIKTEATYDYFTINVRNQSGQWNELWKISGDQSSSGWQYKEISLNQFVGQTGLYIQFRFDSDVNTYPSAPAGVWVDEISCTAQTSSTGNLNVTAQNWNGNAVAGALVLRYTSSWQYIDQKTTGGNGVASWTNITATNYNLEVYYDGNTPPFTGSEYWVNGSAQVPAGGTANVTLRRNEPYTENIVFKNNSTNEVLSPSNPIPPNTTVRAEVTVRNQSPVTRTVRVRVVVDRNKDGSYDHDLSIGPLDVNANGGTRTFTATFTPSAEGLYYRGSKTETYVNSNYALTDTWAWGPTDGAFKVQTLTGNLNVTAQNWNGNAVAGALVLRYTSSWQYIDQKTTGGNGVASWTNITATNYNLEVYYDGNTPPFTGSEYWVNGSAQVPAGGTANVTLRRNEPYTENIVFKNNSTNEVLSPSNPIPPNTTVRAEVTVRNQSPVTRTVRVRVVVDRNKDGSYDHDLSIGPLDVNANGGTRTFTATFTPSAEGLYYRGSKTETYVNSNYALTDTWAWGPTDGAFKVQTLTGNLNVTAQNWNGNAVAGALVLRYTSSWQYIDQKTTGGNGVASWTNITATNYNLEVYYDGNTPPFTGSEYWVNGSAQVPAGGTANVTLRRNEPYTENIVFKNNSTNEVLSPSNPIPPNTTVRAEVTVRNQSPVTRTVRVRVVVDRNKDGSYDHDLSIGPLDVNANGGTRTFTATFTPSAEGLYYRGSKTETYVNSNYALTDTWAWGPTDGAFKVQTLYPPSVKIIGVVQKAHEDPTAIDSNKVGIKILARVLDSISSVTEVKLSYDNLNDLPWWSETRDMTNLGTGYYSLTLDDAFLGLLKFQPGNRIKWRIQAKNSQGSYGYYPSATGWDTTTVLGYSSFKKGLRITNMGKGVVKAEVANEDSMQVWNNKAIALKFSTSQPDILRIEGDLLADFIDVLYGKSFPFGFLNPPSLLIDNFRSLPDSLVTEIHISKWGPNYEAFAVTAFNFICDVSGLSSGIDPNNRLKKVAFVKDCYYIFSVFYNQWFHSSGFTNLTSVSEKVWFIAKKMAEAIKNNEAQVRDQIISALINRMGEEAATRLALKIISFASVIGYVDTFNNAMSAAFSTYDFLTTPDDDQIQATKRAGHHVRLSLDELPGVDISSPIFAGSAQTFSVKIVNLSNYQKLYNLWLGLDILHYDPDSGKVENTKTDFVDSGPGGTNHIGRIEFVNQAVPFLNPGDSIIFQSLPYSFTNSVTGFTYKASRYPYYYISRVWTNGEPGQQFPTPAISLNENLIKKPFFIADNIPPHAPTNLQVLFETDSTAQLTWHVHALDTLDIDSYIIYTGTDTVNMNPIDTVDASMNNGVVQILKTNNPQYVKVKIIDIGGLVSPLSNQTLINSITDVVEFGQHIAIPKKYALYQNYPNPFNPYTIIRYDLPKNGIVTIDLFDVTGRKVRTLLSGEKTAGTYSIGLDGHSQQLSTGTYFYTITVIPTDASSSFRDTKKMLLIR